VRLAQLARIIAELLRQARPPLDVDEIAGLPHRAGPPRSSTRHEARMTPMGARQQRCDEAALTVRPHRQHDAFVAPVHAADMPAFAGRRQTAIRAN
jgi:hypothetical protein